MKKTELEHTLHNVMERMAKQLELVRARLNHNPDDPMAGQDMCDIETMFADMKDNAELAENAVAGIRRIL
jgi:hypothetical protein